MRARQIVFFLPDLGLGGAQRVVATLARHMSAHGDEVTIATLGPTTNDHVEVPPGVERWAIQPSDGPRGPVAIVVKNLRRAGHVRRRLRERRPDAVIAFVDSTNLFVLVATRGLGIPVVVSERVDPREHRISVAQRLLRRLLYPTAAGLVVQTARIAVWARRVVRPTKLHVIANPVPIPRRVSQPEEPPLIVAAGRLVRQKGFDLLLEALGRLPDGMLWRCEIVGDGPDRAELESRARRLGLDDRVVLPGRVDDVEDRLARASIFVLSSRFEGFPNVLTEAMALGVACVASDCPTGPRELIVDGMNGRLVAVENVAAMTDAIADLLDDRDERARLGEAARASLAAFDPEAVARRWAELLDGVIR